MPARSAGVLLYRWKAHELEALLIRPGGPYWRRRDAGAWQIPKGLIEEGEDARAAARREAEEELGLPLLGELQPLGSIRQVGGKIVEGFMLEHDVDPSAVRSNTFEMEWPPRSGRRRSFPEVEEARWMSLDTARAVILPSQMPLLDRLAEMLNVETVAKDEATAADPSA